MYSVRLGLTWLIRSTSLPANRSGFGRFLMRNKSNEGFKIRAAQGLHRIPSSQRIGWLRKSIILSGNLNGPYRQAANSPYKFVGVTSVVLVSQGTSLKDKITCKQTQTVLEQDKLIILRSSGPITTRTILLAFRRATVRGSFSLSDVRMPEIFVAFITVVGL